jgi:Fe-S-cluster containining protein
MCCDGTVFADVKLSPDDLSRISTNRSSSEFKLTEPRRNRLPQPCPAWAGGKCAIYRVRPDHCRNFDCALLQKAKTGSVDPETALRVVRSCRRKADKVRKLLLRLGDRNEELSLMTRFRRTLRRHENSVCDPATADLVASLTLAAHDLNRALARHIYP